MTSPFASCGNALIEKGVSVIPIEPSQKFPARFDGAIWKPFKDWERYCQRYANDAELDAWEVWPDCGIGVALGKLSNLIVIDVDVDDPEMQRAIEMVLPRSPVVKKGSQGYAAFYRYNGEHTQRLSAVPANELKARRVVEILSDGTQAVLPPSLHPSGERYAWLTVDTLENFDLDDLPQLPLTFRTDLEHALEPWAGGEHSESSSGLAVGSEVPDYQISAADFAELRKAVMLIPADDRDTWVKVGMCLRTIGGEGFELWCEWSATSEKYDEKARKEMVRRWNGFGTYENGLTYESIFKMSRPYGYEDPPLPDYFADLMAGREEALKKPAKTGLYLTPESELGALKAPDWLLKKHLPAGSLAMLYGPSGGGKSFMAIDMGLAVARGIDWQGQEVKQGSVVYVAGEGGRGLNARRMAWRQHHNVPDEEAMPFYITSQPVPLLDRQRVNELLAVISTLPEIPLLIIIDTLNRNFGDGDENTTKDMTNFVDALAHLQMVTRACVLVVHHTGKGDSELARGNSSLRAAMDVEAAMKVSADGIQLVCTKQKDAAEFTPKGFKLEVIDLGVDEDGEEITSCVMVKGEASALAEGFVAAQKASGTIGEGKNSKLKKNQRKVLKAVRDLVNKTQEAGENPDIYVFTTSQVAAAAEAYDCDRQRAKEGLSGLHRHGVVSPSLGSEGHHMVNLDAMVLALKSLAV